MRLDFTVGVYVARSRGEWTALVPQRTPVAVEIESDARAREMLAARLREALRKASPDQQELFQLPLGTELVRVPVEVKLRGGTRSGLVPFVVEPRWTAPDRQQLLAYHPLDRRLWLVAPSDDELPALAQALVREHWGDVEDPDDLDDMMSDGKDRLETIALSVEPRTLIDGLPSRRQDGRAAAAPPRTERVLHELATDETRAASAGTTALGVPRSPYRERLAFLMSGAHPRSVAVVGPRGAGKTVLIRQWIAARLVEDGYPIHKNLDRCHHVWRLSGKRLIAGMSYLGQWEERCLAVLEEARRDRGILWLEDLHLFGRLGQSRQSERSFADFFRGPVRRGDLAIVAELTPEQHARLERDAPGLAEALALVALPAATPQDTAVLLLHEVRALEARLEGVAMHPFVARTALELGPALFPWQARPGVAIEIVRRVAHDAHEKKLDREIGPGDVLDYLARATGLAPKLISLDEPLDELEVEEAFAQRVIGQPVATAAATDVIVKVRAGLADPGRPVSVLLFTGPTGTGKTELATAIAEYLYGDASRLVRIDMGELTGADAVARLIGGDGGDGLLTGRVRAQPFCVVLLDEIEKAHPRALNLLLQLFDEGRLTDAAGEVASFASAVVIMTSNLGSRSAQPIGFGDARERILADVARAVREFFPVELFNRIDRVVPFEPLTPEVAARVVDKELGKLLARRGLRERNTFVYAGAAIRKRAVSDAFDPRYGARTVKRWLEDHVAGALTDLLAAAPPARLRIVRLADDAGTIRATLEPMAERAPVPGPYVLEGALDLATAGLEAPAAAAAAALARVRASPLYARARDAATSEVRYYVDELELRLTALEQLLGRAPAAREHEHELEPERFERRLVTDRGDARREGRVRTRGPTRGLPPAGRDALISAIAEALLIERALPTLLDPDAHAVTMIVSRIGAMAEAEGLVRVLQPYTASAWCDAAATCDDHGKIQPTHYVKRRRGWSKYEQWKWEIERDPAEVSRGGKQKGWSSYDDWQKYWRGQRDAVLVLRGLFVRAALEHDHGTWMLRSHGAEPDVIRVEVRPGAAAAPEDVLRAHRDARAALERALEMGGALPPNPDVLLPVTRTLTFRPPARAGGTYAFELEDFATGWIDRGAVRQLEDAIRRAWYLSWSRVSHGPASPGRAASRSDAEVR